MEYGKFLGLSSLYFFASSRCGGSSVENKDTMMTKEYAESAVDWLVLHEKKRQRVSRRTSQEGMLMKSLYATLTSRASFWVAW